MIFRRGKKRNEVESPETAEELEPSEVDPAEVDPEKSGSDEPGTAEPGTGEPETDALDPDAPDTDELDTDELDAAEWRDEGPWDVSEIDEPEDDEGGPRIDLGSVILTGVPGSELRLQVAEDTQQIVSAMLIIQTTLEADPAGNGEPPTVTSALELGAYAAPRSGGYWPELREEISASATESGGSASLNAGPFGVELFRLFPVATPDGEEGYQPSKMWVAEGPRWLLRGIVYGQAAIEDNDDSRAVADVVSAFRKVVVRRGDEAMAPGDLLPLHMPANLVTEDQP